MKICSPQYIQPCVIRGRQSYTLLTLLELTKFRHIVSIKRGPENVLVIVTQSKLVLSAEVID